MKKLFLIANGAYLCINSAIISAAGISADAETIDNIRDTIVQDTVIVSNNQAMSESLKGTCPRGLCCSSPHCGRWSDVNADNTCDRGVQ